jgi:hypothetical protein
VLPLDAVCFGLAWHEHFEFGRPLYVLAHDVLHMLGDKFAKLLADSGVEIDLGGRTGFVAQAIRWNVPITPVVSVGGHETLFVLASGYDFARRVGLRRLVRSADAFPLIAGLPWGVWALPFLPQLPLPAKITIEVLEPIRLSHVLGRRLTRADADDPEVLQAGYAVVIGRMRERINRLYDERRWPVLG